MDTNTKLLILKTVDQITTINRGLLELALPLTDNEQVLLVESSNKLTQSANKLMESVR